MRSTAYSKAERRNIPAEYDPRGAYDFPSWRQRLTPSIRGIYETLHETLPYTDEKQDFDKALDTFLQISSILRKSESEIVHRRFCEDMKLQEQHICK